MYLPLFIAKRYLFAKKSHNVINIISLISAIGITIGTAALIVVLSVYNGFESLVSDIYDNYDTDVMITPSHGKSFSPNTLQFDNIRKDGRVASFCEIVEENVFVTYDNAQGIAIIKGVDSVFQATTPLANHIVDGDFELLFGEISQAVVGRGLASEMKIMPRFLDPLDIYFPARGETISIIDPLSSLRKETLFPVGIVSVEKGFDSKYIFIPIRTARRLLGLTNEVTSLEINIKDGIDKTRFIEELRTLLPDDYTVKDRYQQNETVYKMMMYEKVAIYMILFFIILVISCNVFGSLTMLIIEKREDMGILKAMGATELLIKRIFILEGWLISFLGVILGAVIGIALCIIQQQFGVIDMPGNFVVKAYPVIIQLSDILISIGVVSLIGFLVAVLPVKNN